MKTAMPRTALAAVLMVATLLPPSIAWFVVGAREVEREAARLESQPRQTAEATAVRLADRLAAQLEGLRDRESRRPWYHYQPFYHDPEGASEGAAVARSPLARGSDDPLVLAYLQVEGSGRITGPEDGERGSGSRAAQRFGALATDAIAWRAAQPRAPEATRDRQSAPPQVASQAPSQVASQLSVEVTAPAPPPKVTTERQQLDPTAYAQNVKASQLATDIRRKQSEGGSWPVFETPRERAPITIEVGPFTWRTVRLDHGMTLAALRLVTRPEGRQVQAFVVDSTEVARVLGVAALPARFVPDAARAGRPGAAIAGTGWSVTVEPAADLARAAATANALRARFRGAFAGGMVAAGLAGFGVVGLVWQAERLARQRSRFAAAAAHELRTPLAGLRMYGEMLSEGLGDPQQTPRYARLVAAEAERLGRVVTNVLGFTRLERGTLRVRPEPGDLAAAVREAIERQRPGLEAAGATLALRVEDGLPEARFDRDAIHQILQNLLDNAERYTREVADRSLTVSLARADDAVTLTVADHGSGVPAAARGRMFRAFSRDHEAHPGAGLGIGLAMVRALARAQGGSVSYADAPGGGAAFTVRLPLA